MRHDVDNEVIGLCHGIVSDTCEVMYGSVNVLFDNTFRCFGKGVVYSHSSREDGCGDTACDFKCAGRFCSVADHAGYISDHVFDGERYFVILTSHEVSQSGSGASSGNDSSAKSGEPAE